MTSYRTIAREAEDWGVDDLAGVVLPGHLSGRVTWAALNFYARTVWGESFREYLKYCQAPEHLYVRPVPCPGWCGCDGPHHEATDQPTPEPITAVWLTGSGGR